MPNARLQALIASQLFSGGLTGRGLAAHSAVAARARVLLEAPSRDFATAALRMVEADLTPEERFAAFDRLCNSAKRLDDALGLAAGMLPSRAA